MTFLLDRVDMLGNENNGREEPHNLSTLKKDSWGNYGLGNNAGESGLDRAGSSSGYENATGGEMQRSSGSGSTAAGQGEQGGKADQNLMRGDRSGQEKRKANEMLVGGGVEEKSKVKQEKRRKVAQELANTERTYAQGLRELIATYVTPLTNRGILDEEEGQIAFAGCLQILGLSEQLLASFQGVVQNWDPETSTLGDVFSRYAEFLKLYIPFANNFIRGRKILEKVDSNTQYEKLKKSAMMQNIQPMESLRILPIQRVPRYVLLIMELLKQTEEDHVDFLLLKKALVEVKTVAKQIDQRMNASELEAKTLEIQSSLWVATGSIPELVSPGRRFIKQGPVCKVRASGGLQRNYYLFCFNDLVVYATTNTLFPNRYHFHKAIEFYGAFPADEETLALGVKLKFGETAFKITGSNGYRIFVVFNDSERRDWLKALSDLAGEKEQNRKSWGRARGEVAASGEEDFGDAEED